ncbi:MAG TPA: hypothetical protein VE196_12685 [Pseudonocardiaceae bacterium]|nr:hypothetical protein [Pseudonocardiaceae bacterium]
MTDALSLPRDCLVTDADGAPYLRYDNHEMKRQALVPLDEQLHALIGNLDRIIDTLDDDAPACAEASHAG